MSNLMDTEAGTERFTSYEAELKLVQADLNQQLDEIPELTGEPRKASIAKAERALEEANELVSRCLHVAMRQHHSDPDGAGSWSRN
jgi:vesicle transport through interaction with t-SNAREs 1